MRLGEQILTFHESGIPIVCGDDAWLNQTHDGKTIEQDNPDLAKSHSKTPWRWDIIHRMWTNMLGCSSPSQFGYVAQKNQKTVIVLCPENLNKVQGKIEYGVLEPGDYRDQPKQLPYGRRRSIDAFRASYTVTLLRQIFKTFWGGRCM